MTVLYVVYYIRLVYAPLSYVAAHKSCIAHSYITTLEVHSDILYTALRWRMIYCIVLVSNFSLKLRRLA